jgi:replicative DNA helicase
VRAKKQQTRSQPDLWGEAEELVAIKGLPSSIEAEMAVIGTCIDWPERLRNSFDMITEDCFTQEKHRLLWRTITEMHKRSEKVTMVTLTDALRNADRLEAIGGMSYIMDMSRWIPFNGDIDTYVEVLNDKLLLRRLIMKSGEIVKAAMAGETRATELVQAASQNVLTAAEGVIVKADGIATAGDIIDAAGGFTKMFAGDKGELLPTPWKKVNRLIRGLKPGQVVLGAARPGMGKTVVGLQMASFVTRKLKRDGIVFTFEMSKEEFLLRLVSGYSGIPSELIESGEAVNRPELKARLDIAEREIRKLRLRIVDDVAPTFAAINAYVRKMISVGWRPAIVVIDYLQLMKGSADNRQQEVSDISRSLKLAARKSEWNCVVLALSQLNRAFASRGKRVEDWRPQLTDLRESGSLEQDADKVFFIHRPEMFIDPNNVELMAKYRGKAELIFAKNRQGGLGVVTLDFSGEKSFFYDGDDADDGSPELIVNTTTTKVSDGFERAA